MNKLTEILLPMYVNRVVNNTVRKKIASHIEQQQSSDEDGVDSVALEVYVFVNQKLSHSLI